MGDQLRKLAGAADAPDDFRSTAPWKRPFDLIFGGVLLVGLSPVLAWVALSVRVDSPGPAFYRQDRIGRHGKPFRMWKFRSMQVNSDHNPHHRLAAAWFAADDSARGYKSLPDSRVTRVGGLLRKTGLDELPQLFNVLRGEMSLVGPRPAIPYELEYYAPAYFERQQLLPGITGLWQVHRRDRLSANDMMSLDLEYVRHCSLWLDLKIVARTIPSLLADVIGTR